LKKKEK
jgi:hypothetical protein